MASPLLEIFPSDATVDMPARDSFRIHAVDEDPGTGVDPTTMTLTLTVGTAVIPIIRTGLVIQPGWVPLFTGDPADPVDGMWVWVRPPTGVWEQGTEYTIDTYVENIMGDHSTAHATITTDDYYCIEDDLPTPTAIELRLMNGPLTTQLEHLRKNLLVAISSSKNKQAQARAMLNVASMTDLFSILAGWVDPELANVHVCNRSAPTAVFLKMQTEIPKYRHYTNELTALSKEAKTLVEDRINSANPIYAINALAIAVILGAVFKEKGWV